MSQKNNLRQIVPPIQEPATNAGSYRAVMDQVDEDKRKRKRSKWNIVLAIALVVLIGSLIALALIWFSYFQGQQKYKDIADYANVSDKDLAGLTVDWDALLAINPDTVAWLYIPGTNVNYPVVRGPNNEYYLTHDFDGAQGWLANYGAIFMDYRNNPDWSDACYFIYGHHMNDGSMFADVAALRFQDRFDASRTVYLLSPKGNFRLRTFTMIHCAADDALVQTTFVSPEDMVNYVQDKINRNIVSVNDIPKVEDITKIFALATCDNVDDGRYVLYAYVQDTTVTGLAGKIGISTENGETTGLIDDLKEQ